MDERDIRERLEAERERLLALREDPELAGAEGVSERESLSELSSYDQHPADEGTETFEREQSLTLLQLLDADLSDVDRALRRLDAGEYGRCEACGRSIGEERLRARPAARYCVDDQARLERTVHPSVRADAVIDEGRR